jgi:hypothetical protein
MFNVLILHILARRLNGRRGAEIPILGLSCTTMHDASIETYISFSLEISRPKVPSASSSLGRSVVRSLTCIKLMRLRVIGRATHGHLYPLGVTRMSAIGVTTTWRNADVSNWRNDGNVVDTLATRVVDTSYAVECMPSTRRHVGNSCRRHFLCRRMYAVESILCMPSNVCRRIDSTTGLGNASLRHAFRIT